MGRRIKPENCLMVKEKELVESEWHYLYNNVLGIAPETLSIVSSKMVYWKCPNCDSVYLMSPSKRLEHKARHRYACFKCRGDVQKRAFTVPI